MADKTSAVLSPSIRCLQYANVALGRPYHAALSMTERSGARGYRVEAHSHDFYEMICVLAGEAVHGINGSEMPLRAGDLILLRPGDWHFIRFQTGRLLHYINIAVDACIWQSFHELAGIGQKLEAPVIRNSVISAPENSLTEDYALAFRRALLCFQDTRMAASLLRTEAFHLLATVAPCLLADGRADDSSETSLPDGTPVWLVSACRLMQTDLDALRIGLPAFVSASGVSPTHLARVLKKVLNETPTEYINRLRLLRAARLLTTTTLSILDIAGECGFEQPGYFYRLFRANFQTSPHAYRIAAAQRVAPAASAR